MSSRLASPGLDPKGGTDRKCKQVGASAEQPGNYWLDFMQI